MKTASVWQRIKPRLLTGEREAFAHTLKGSSTEANDLGQSFHFLYNRSTFANVSEISTLAPAQGMSQDAQAEENLNS